MKRHHIVDRSPPAVERARRRLVASEIYEHEGLPSIFLRAEREQIDFLVIDSFVRHLARSRESGASSAVRLPVLIVIDEAATRKQDLRRLSHFLISRGTPAVILAVARENEWAMVLEEHSIKTAACISVSDDLSIEQNESSLIIAHFRSLGVFVSSQEDSYWTKRIDVDYQNSFQTTLYYLAEPTRPPLLQSIVNEYDRLSPLAQQAYRHVCMFYQFGIPLDLELLARSLGRSYADFTESVFNPASIGVIIDDVAIPGTVRFRARSRHVAEIMIRHAYTEGSGWALDLQKVAGSVLPQNANEVETLRTMLIRLVGRGGSPSILPSLDLRPSFEATFKAGMRDAALLHHFGLLLAGEGDFEDAEKFLSQAIAVLDDPTELSHFKSASRQHLYNSMGMIAAKFGLQLEKSGKQIDADRQFARAVEYFRSARLGQHPNSYPYYCESLMLYNRAKSSSGRSRLQLLASALQVLDESEGNVAEDEKSSLLEMEAKVVQYLGTIPNLNDALVGLKDEGDVSGHYLQARLAAGLYTDGYDIRSAYAIVTKALQGAPSHVPCLRLATRLYRKLHPTDWEGWWKLLKQQYQLEGGEASAAFFSISDTPHVNSASTQRRHASLKSSARRPPVTHRDQASSRW